MLTNFDWNKAKKKNFFLKKKSKMADSKKLSFSKPAIPNIFSQKFLRLVLIIDVAPFRGDYKIKITL